MGLLKFTTRQRLQHFVDTKHVNTSNPHTPLGLITDFMEKYDISNRRNGDLLFTALCMVGKFVEPRILLPFAYKVVTEAHIAPNSDDSCRTTAERFLRHCVGMHCSRQGSQATFDSVYKEYSDARGENRQLATAYAKAAAMAASKNTSVGRTYELHGLFDYLQEVAPGSTGFPQIADAVIKRADSQDSLPERGTLDRLVKISNTFIGLELADKARKAGAVLLRHAIEEQKIALKPRDVIEYAIEFGKQGASLPIKAQRSIAILAANALTDPSSGISDSEKFSYADRLVQTFGSSSAQMKPVLDYMATQLNDVLKPRSSEDGATDVTANRAAQWALLIGPENNDQVKEFVHTNMQTLFNLLPMRAFGLLASAAGATLGDQFFKEDAPGNALSATRKHEAEWNDHRGKYLPA